MGRSELGKLRERNRDFDEAPGDRLPSHRSGGNRMHWAMGRKGFSALLQGERAVPWQTTDWDG